MNIKIKKLAHAVEFYPSYATEHSAGMDLLSANIEPIIIKSSEIKLVPTGISIALPACFEAQIRPRSGLAIKHGITVLNSPGTIDADYRGEIKVILINHSKEDFLIVRGMKIAQIIIASYERVFWEKVDYLNKTLRNRDGFGSTGN